ncbi:1-acyl-sn-glycerol-3-phosphate acyltransferase, partial [Enterobacter roggenkampii]|uniref:lysophospholipid acyltransferase family protein n=3 Tax=Enterobacteriaceae TaxID=543 RepID=UPI002230AA57
AWRLVMTGFCFALFGIGGLLLSVVWFNLLLLLVWNPVRRRRLARRSIAASFRAFLTVAKTLGVLDYRIEGSDVLRQEKGCLVVANHPTLIDYVLLASVMPETDCLVKSALLKNPFVSGVIRAADYLINSQADALL